MHKDWAELMRVQLSGRIVRTIRMRFAMMNRQVRIILFVCSDRLRNTNIFILGT